MGTLTLFDRKYFREVSESMRVKDLEHETKSKSPAYASTEQETKEKAKSIARNVRLLLSNAHETAIRLDALSQILKSYQTTDLDFVITILTTLGNSLCKTLPGAAFGVSSSVASEFQKFYTDWKEFLASKEIKTQSDYCLFLGSIGIPVEKRTIIQNILNEVDNQIDQTVESVQQISQKQPFAGDIISKLKKMIELETLLSDINKAKLIKSLEGHPTGSSSAKTKEKISHLKRLLKTKRLLTECLDKGKIPRWFHATIFSNLENILKADQMEYRCEQLFGGVWLSDIHEKIFGDHALIFDTNLENLKDQRGAVDVDKYFSRPGWRGVQTSFSVHQCLRYICAPNRDYKMKTRAVLQDLPNFKQVQVISQKQADFMRSLFDPYKYVISNPNWRYKHRYRFF